jgi:hypothetical protein
LTQNNYVTICMELLSDAESKQCRMLRLWLLIGMGRLWADCNDARWQAVRLVAYDRVRFFSRLVLTRMMVFLLAGGLLLGRSRARGARRCHLCARISGQQSVREQRACHSGSSLRFIFIFFTPRSLIACDLFLIDSCSRFGVKGVENDS